MLGASAAGRRIRPKALTNIQKIKLIEETHRARDQPDAEQGRRATSSWSTWTATGSWCACGAPAPPAPSRHITLKHYVENKLRELVSPELVVEEVP